MQTTPTWPPAERHHDETAGHHKVQATAIPVHPSTQLPKCIQCRHIVKASPADRFDRCHHPAHGVDLVRGLPIAPACDLVRHTSRNQTCGDVGQWFEAITDAQVNPTADASYTHIHMRLKEAEAQIAEMNLAEMRSVTACAGQPTQALQAPVQGLAALLEPTGLSEDEQLRLQAWLTKPMFSQDEAP